MKIEGVDLLLVPKLITGWTDFNRVFMKRSIQLTVKQQGSNQFYFGLIIKSTQKCDSNKSTGRKVRKTLIKAKKSGGRRSLKNFNPLKSPILLRSPILPVVRPTLESPNQSTEQKGALGALLANALKRGSVGYQVPNQPSEQPWSAYTNKYKIQTLIYTVFSYRWRKFGFQKNSLEMIFSGVNLSHCTFCSRWEISHWASDESSFEILGPHHELHPVSKLLEVLLHYLPSWDSIGPGCFFIFDSISRDPVVNKLDTSSGLSGSLRDAKKTFRNKK